MCTATIEVVKFPGGKCDSCPEEVSAVRSVEYKDINYDAAQARAKLAAVNAAKAKVPSGCQADMKSVQYDCSPKTLIQA